MDIHVAIYLYIFLYIYVIIEENKCIYIYIYTIIEEIRGLTLHLFCITWIDHSEYIFYTALLFAIPQRYIFIYVFEYLTFMRLTLWYWITSCRLSYPSNLAGHIRTLSEVLHKLEMYIPFQFFMSPPHCTLRYFNAMHILLSLLWYIFPWHDTFFIQSALQNMYFPYLQIHLIIILYTWYSQIVWEEVCQNLNR